MNIALLALAALIALATTAKGDPNFENLMDRIERGLRLPDEAAPFSAYARHYALQSDGKVVGIYVLREPAPARDPDYGCEELILDEDGVSTKSIPCSPGWDTPEQPGAGERQWFDDYGKLPRIDDGGCIVINVIYDPTTDRVEHAFCNGVA